jgi:hypothetical protein
MPSVIRFDRQQSTAGTLFGHVIQTVHLSWSPNFQTSSVQSYVAVTGGTATITPFASGSRFHIIANIQGYSNNTGGLNIGLERVLGGTTTRLVGTNGGAGGDSWAGTANGNGGNTNNSYTISRFWSDSPGVSAGTAITYNVLTASWSSGIVYIGYPGYTSASTITIQEIQV